MLQTVYGPMDNHSMDVLEESSQLEDAPGTPPRPPYSPVTPVMSHSTLFPSTPSASIIPPPPSLSTVDIGQISGSSSFNNTMPRSLFLPEPPTVPVSESDNPDVIALRSAISILQLQKQQALRDIQALDKMKRVAATDPEAFARELLAGNLTPKQGDIFNPASPEADEHDMEVDDIGDLGQRQEQLSENNIRFGKIPKAQNIVRMPPINWAKYQIVGEPLDKLHEEQRRRPSPSEPRRDMPTQRAQEHVIAAPYRPFIDKLEPPMRTRSSNKPKR